MFKCSFYNLKYWQIKICFVIFIIISYTSCSYKSSDIISSQQKLGHYLFFDTRLSLNNTKSCASCHNPQFAFTDGYRKSITSLGDNVLHNSPSLLNCIYLKKYDWANTKTNTLIEQIQRPLYNNHPVELGLDKHLDEIRDIFLKDSIYKILFKQAFPTEKELFTKKQIEIAIVEYEKTLVSIESNFDKNKLSPEAINGFKLFSSNKLK